MTTRTRARCAAALGVALGLSTAPALAAGPISPGFIWFGQAAGGAGAGAGSNGTAGAGANGTGGTGVGGAGVGGTGVGAGATGNVGATGNGTGSGVAAPGTATGVGNANGTGAAGNGTTGTDNGTGTTGGNGTNGNNGTNGTNSVGSSQNGTTGTNGTGTGGGRGSLPVPGASGLPQLFDLPATVRAALQSSADIQTATRNIEIDRRRSDEAAAQGRPNVAASGTAIRYDQATKIALGGGPPLEVTPTHQEILTLNVSNRFDLTGQIRAASDQARLQSLADEFVLGQIRNGRILRAQTIYFNTLRAQHQVDVAQAALNNAERQLQDATNLNAAGVGQRIDVLRAQTQVATAQQNLDAAQNNFSIALTSFNDLVGRPLPAPVRLVDPPGVIIRQPVRDFSNVGAPDPKAQPPLPGAPQEVGAINIDRALQTANAQRPEILQAQVNVRVAETGVKLSRSGLEPTFSLSAAGNYYPTPSFQFPRQRVGQLTATLNIPLYDGGATRDRVQEARLRTQNAQTSLGSTQSDVALDVRQAYLNLATAAQQIGAANAALQSAIGARQLAQLRYQGQVGLYLEVTDAQAALVQAENNQVDAVYNYLVARAQFQNAVGAPQVQ
jgi:outer membrane protein